MLSRKLDKQIDNQSDRKLDKQIDNQSDRKLDKIPLIKNLKINNDPTEFKKQLLINLSYDNIIEQMSYTGEYCINDLEYYVSDGYNNILYKIYYNDLNQFNDYCKDIKKFLSVYNYTLEYNNYVCKIKYKRYCNIL